LESWTALEGASVRHRRTSPFFTERIVNPRNTRRVYVLNNSYECVSQTTVGRAIYMIESHAAEVVRWSDEVVKTVRRVVRIPLIIRIFKYVRAFGRILKYTNRFVWERDDFYCQYCHKKITSKADLQTDHVIPESRGGKTTYDNMVTACRECNAKKDNKTPFEAHMTLLRKPVRPQMSKNMAKIADEAKRIMTEEVGL